MNIIDGKKIASELRNELKKEISVLKSKYNSIPGLTVILVGEDPASKIYVRMKEKLRGDHDYEARVEEQKFLDEIAGSRSVKDPQ